MKRLLPLLLLATLTTHAQEIGYVSFSIDPNKAFGIIDNPRTDPDHTGLNFNIELGVPLTEKTKVYLYYSRFEEIDYQNLGTGADYYLAEGDWYDISLGAGVGMLMRKFMAGADYERPAWFSWVTWHTRLQGTFWAWRNFGATASIKYQRRGDLPEVGGIIEGNIGLRYKI